MMRMLHHFSKYQLSQKFNDLQIINHDYHGWAVRTGGLGVVASLDTKEECEDWIKQYNEAISEEIQT